MSKIKYYAGIGSRQTPITLIPKIDGIVNHLNDKGYTLRSGGAVGADTFFEKNAIKKEIFLPWKLYNNNESELYHVDMDLLEFAAKYYPRLENASEGVKKLMIRNCNQVLGDDLNKPVDFIVCWTKDGKASGGTGMALRIAKAYHIPIFNLYNELAFNELHKFLNPINIFL